MQQTNESPRLLVLVTPAWLHVDLSHEFSLFKAALALCQKVLAFEDVGDLPAAEFEQLQGEGLEGEVFPLVEDVLVVLEVGLVDVSHQGQVERQQWAHFRHSFAVGCRIDFLLTVTTGRAHEDLSFHREVLVVVAICHFGVLLLVDSVVDGEDVLRDELVVAVDEYSHLGRPAGVPQRLQDRPCIPALACHFHHFYLPSQPLLQDELVERKQGFGGHGVGDEDHAIVGVLLVKD